MLKHFSISTVLAEQLPVYQVCVHVCQQGSDKLRSFNFTLLQILLRVRALKYLLHVNSIRHILINENLMCSRKSLWRR